VLLLLLLISTSHGVTWNIRPHYFQFSFTSDGVAVSNNQVFIAASDQRLRRFDVVNGAITSFAQMPTTSGRGRILCGSEWNSSLFTIIYPLNHIYCKDLTKNMTPKLLLVIFKMKVNLRASTILKILTQSESPLI
jgi:hypothetical protein